MSGFSVKHLPYHRKLSDYLKIYVDFMLIMETIKE